MKYIALLAMLLVITGCGGSGGSGAADTPGSSAAKSGGSDGKGVGEIKHVDLTNPFDATMLSSGKMIYDMKCSACHKLTDQRVVGPGWAGITNRRKPEWIMNMITNVDVMLEEDPEARKLLEECLVRMPNQGVSVTEARGLLEYMRENDEKQVGTKDGAVGH